MTTAPARRPSRSLRLAALLVTALSLAAGCGKRSAEPAAAPLAPAAAQVAPAVLSPGTPSQGQAPAPAASRALRITVETSVTVADLDASVRALRGAVERLGGYVGEARLASGETRRASLELRVPAARLGELRAELGRLGEIESESEKAEDVTEQRADLDARLRNARAQEKRLLDLLSDKTGSLADVVAVERELASVRDSVERMEASQRVLEKQIAFATVKVELSTTRAAVAAVGPGRRIARALGEGVDAAGAFLVGLAVLLASSGPTLAIVAALGYALYRGVRWARRGKRPLLASAPPAEAAGDG
jgi:small-conductance mechanosensitive channel